MTQKQWLAIGSVGIAALIGGYLIGGWVYEAAGNRVWESPTNFVYQYQGLIAGLAAAGGALFAAWLAWSAVQSQLGQERANRFEDQRVNRIGVCQTAMIDLLTFSARVRADTPGLLTDNAGWTLKRLSVDVAKIDGFLGASMIAFDDEIRIYRNITAAAQEQMRTAISFRAYVLSLALRNAIDRLAADELPSRPHLTVADIEEAKTGTGAEGDTRLNYMTMLITDETMDDTADQVVAFMKHDVPLRD